MRPLAVMLVGGLQYAPNADGTLVDPRVFACRHSPVGLASQMFAAPVEADSLWSWNHRMPQIASIIGTDFSVGDRYGCASKLGAGVCTLPTTTRRSETT